MKYNTEWVQEALDQKNELEAYYHSVTSTIQQENIARLIKQWDDEYKRRLAIISKMAEEEE
ncbi:MAG: hypothetical protein KDD50_16675 [Bdellovibrionales bacterium]|nr:hypothetical protein [Bdellovibrionales bacterium]